MGADASAPTTLPLPSANPIPYNRQAAWGYHAHHRTGWARRLSHLWEQHLAARALAIAGHPQVVLDLPCGTGRFWPLLARDPERIIIGADRSADMLAVAARTHPPELLARVERVATSAFGTGLPGASVDHVFCMRFLHHLEQPQDRLAVLAEFHRLTRRTVSLSLWVDGNWKAWRRRRRTADPTARRPPRRYLVPSQEVEREFRASGFEVRGRLDFLRWYSMWRVYVLAKR